MLKCRQAFEGGGPAQKPSLKRVVMASVRAV